MIRFICLGIVFLVSFEASAQVSAFRVKALFDSLEAQKKNCSPVTISNFVSPKQIEERIADPELPLRVYKKLKEKRRLFLIDEQALRTQFPEIDEKTFDLLVEQASKAEEEVTKVILNTITSSFKAGIQKVIGYKEALPDDMVRFFEARYDDAAIQSLRRTPYIIVKDATVNDGQSSQDVGGLSLNTQNAEFEDINFDLNLDVNGESRSVKISILGKAYRDFFKAIILEVFDSPNLIVLEEDTLLPGANPLWEIKRRWVLAEETAHNLDHAKYAHLNESKFTQAEEIRLRDIATQKRDVWLESDTTEILKHSDLQDFLDFLRSRKKDEDEDDVDADEQIPDLASSDEGKRYIREVINEDFPRHYTHFWPYLASEAELRGKWQATQYLKIHQKTSLSDILQINLIERDVTPDRSEDQDANQRFWFMSLPQTFVDFYKELYNSDTEVPLTMPNR